MTKLWPAPFHPAPVRGTVDVPGSKSLMARYMIVAAMGDQPATILAPLRARDTELMADALTAMGATVDWQRAENETDDVLTITPGPAKDATVEAGLAGTVMRFVPPLAALSNGTVHMDGDEAARVRPMDPVVQALRTLGVKVDSAENAEGKAVLPLTVHGTGGVKGGKLDIDSSASSQFISALLLAAPRFEEGLYLNSVGRKAPSTPHLRMTVDVLRRAGITVDEFGRDGNPATDENPATAWRVHPGVPNLGTVTVEPDLSNASPFLAAAMVTGGSVSIPRWPVHTTQPGAQAAPIFEKMGATVEFEETGDGVGTLTLHGPEVVQPLDRELRDVGELTPTIAAVCAAANGDSRLRNIGQLRGHETNRLEAITTELGKLGIHAEEIGDDIAITDPRAARAAWSGKQATLLSYEDHRMATFGAIIGLFFEGISVENIETTSKTMPNFAHMWESLVLG